MDMSEAEDKVEKNKKRRRSRDMVRVKLRVAMIGCFSCFVGEEKKGLGKRWRRKTVYKGRKGDIIGNVDVCTIIG